MHKTNNFRNLAGGVEVVDFPYVCVREGDVVILHRPAISDSTEYIAS